MAKKELNRGDKDWPWSNTVRVKSSGVISCKFDEEIEIGAEPSPIPWTAPVVAAFLDDIDLVEMTVVSSNIGFVKTITKKFN